MEDLKKNLKKALIEYDRKRKSEKIIRILALIGFCGIILLLFGSFEISEPPMKPKYSLSNPATVTATEKSSVPKIRSGCSWIRNIEQTETQEI